ncbi:MAG TPA: ComF family protein [Verrucomicrobiae bacterium]|jgi:ComF family protein
MGAFSTNFKPWVDTALSLAFPDVCQLCRMKRAKKRDGYVCADCRAKVRSTCAPFCERCGLPFGGEITGSFECANCREMELHFASARSAVTAHGPVLDAIHRYKYDGQMWFEEFLTELFVRGASDWFREHAVDALVPVPLYPVKQRERGFNQAERLARRLGAAVNVPVRNDILKRVLPTPTQTRLSRTQRAENMRHAFALKREERFKGATFVLIDDVFTTGATASACAKLLLKTGCERVTVWTVARAEYHG